MASMLFASAPRSSSLIRASSSSPPRLVLCTPGQLFSSRSRCNYVCLSSQFRDSGCVLSDGLGRRASPYLQRGGFRFVCSYQAKEEPGAEDSGLDWPILQRWEVPWEWQTVALTMLGCGLSFVLTGLLETMAAPYLGLLNTEMTLDDKAGILFIDQFIVTGVVLGVVYGITNSFKPLPDDFFRYKLKDPFSLEDGLGSDWARGGCHCYCFTRSWSSFI